MKRTWARLAAGACVALAWSGAGIGAQEPFEWNGRLARGGTLEVKGISGSIRAEPTSGSSAVVVAEKTGRRGDFDQVEIRVVKHGDDVTICAVHGDADGGDDCSGRGSTRRGLFRRDRSIHVSVDFVVKLPAGTPLKAELISGDVDVRGVESDVTAATVSGDITISTSGLARAHAVSGSLDVAMGATEWDELDFNTVSGDITLRLPEATAADLEFQSVSGDLTSDFDLRLTGRIGRRWPGQPLRAKLGEGGRAITLRTVSGDVRLLRAG